MSFQGGRFGGTPPVVKNLIIINVLLLVITFLVKGTMGFDLTYKLGLFYFKSEYFRPYQLVTHMFMHGGFAHIFFNMLMLWMFGRILESVWGSKRFLIYFLFTGLGAAFLHLFVNHLHLSGMIEAAETFFNNPTPGLYRDFVKSHISNPNPKIYDFLMEWEENPDNATFINNAVQQIKNYIQVQINIPTVGASGAVYGILLAFGILFPNTELMLIFLPFFPIKAKYMILFMIGIELMMGLSMPGSNIAHFAHLGGMLFGYILIRYWNLRRQNFY